MNGTKSLVFACVLVMMITGCAHNRNGKTTATTRPTRMAAAKATTRPTETVAATATTRPAEAHAAAAAPAPAVPPDVLAGEWSLAIPRRGFQQAKITFTDATHVKIAAGENLGGDYVIQGNYLLILTRDERLRPLAWRINSPDSLTVVRSPDWGAGGADFTGASLVRAPSTADAARNEEEEAAAGIQEVLR